MPTVECGCYIMSSWVLDVLVDFDSEMTANMEIEKFVVGISMI